MWISFVSTCISTYFFRHMSTSRDNQWKSLRSLRLFPSRASDACHLCEPRFYLHFFQPSCPNLSVTWIPIPVPKGPSSEPRSPKHRAGIRRKKVVSAVDPSENKAIHDQHCFGGWIWIWNMMSWWTSWTTLAVMHWQTAAKPNEIVAIENWKTPIHHANTKHPTSPSLYGMRHTSSSVWLPFGCALPNPTRLHIWRTQPAKTLFDSSMLVANGCTIYYTYSFYDTHTHMCI